MKQERDIVNIAEMVSPEHNVRIHPERQIKELMRSLDKFGQCRDIVLDENNSILAGNGLKEAMERRGDKTATVIRILGLTEKEKLKFILADNKTFSLGVEDHNGINAVLEMLGTELDIPGYDEDTLRAIVAGANEVTERLMEYGTINEQEISSIKAAGERMENAAANNARREAAGEIERTDDSAPYEAAEQRKSITCPHCEEIIWL